MRIIDMLVTVYLHIHFESYVEISQNLQVLASETRFPINSNRKASDNVVLA